LKFFIIPGTVAVNIDNLMMAMIVKPVVPDDAGTDLPGDHPSRRPVLRIQTREQTYDIDSSIYGEPYGTAENAFNDLMAQAKG